MKTDHTTPVLMSPEQLPQQRLAELSLFLKTESF